MIWAEAAVDGRGHMRQAAPVVGTASIGVPLPSVLAVCGRAGMAWRGGHGGGGKEQEARTTSTFSPYKQSCFPHQVRWPTQYVP